MSNLTDNAGPSFAPDFNPPDHLRFHPRRTQFVRVMAVLIVAVVLALVALTGYRSARVHTPSAAVVLNGDPSLDGTVIHVTGEGRGSTRGVDVSVTLNAANAYRTPVLLDPGSYRVTVTHAGQKLIDQEVELMHFQGLVFELPSAVWIYGSSSLGDLRVELTSVSEPRLRPLALLLDANNQYRAVVHLVPGVSGSAASYHLVARIASEGTRIVKEEDFSVSRAYPTRVDLNKVSNPDGSAAFAPP